MVRLDVQGGGFRGAEMAVAEMAGAEDRGAPVEVGELVDVYVRGETACLVDDLRSGL